MNHERTNLMNRMRMGKCFFEYFHQTFVHNSIGQIVLMEHDIIKNEYLHFDVSKLESGFYFVEVITAEERVVRKFVRE